jgi:hypothetical protein
VVAAVAAAVAGVAAAAAAVAAVAEAAAVVVVEEGEAVVGALGAVGAVEVEVEGEVERSAEAPRVGRLRYSGSSVPTPRPSYLRWVLRLPERRMHPCC